MKSSISFFLSLILTTSSFSQTINDLENKKGFKEFRLGDSYHKWSNQLREISNTSNNSDKLYHYEGYCCRQAFQNEVDHIFLSFKDNKLIDITVFLKNFRVSKNSDLQIGFEEYPEPYMRLLNDFNSIFGNYNKKSLSGTEDAIFDGGEMWSTYWESQNVVLIVKYHNYLKYDYSTFSILDKNELIRKRQSSF